MSLPELHQKAVLEKLRCYYHQIAKKQDVNREEVLRYACLVLDDNQSSAATKKIASQIKYAIEPYLPKDWISMTTFVDFCDVDALVAFVKLWIPSTFKHSLGSSSEEFLFLSDFIQRVAKKKEAISQKLTDEEFSLLRRRVLIISLSLYECRSEDVTHLIKSALRLYGTEQERADIRKFCLEEFPSDSPCSIFCIGLLCDSDILTLEEKQKLINLIPFWANTQDLATLSSGIVTSLIVDDSVIELIHIALEKCIFSWKSTVRKNVTRVWLARLPVTKQSITVFFELLQRLRSKWENCHNLCDDSFWPPQVYETEDVSCIDSQWQWQEAEDVFCYRDKIVSAYVSVWALCIRKFKNVKMDLNDQILRAGLTWAISDIRLQAFRLLRTIRESENAIGEFIMANVYSQNDDIVKEMTSAMLSFHVSAQVRSYWDEYEKYKRNVESQENEAGSCFVSKDDIGSVVELPPDHLIPKRIIHLLLIGGSSEQHLCPSFPELYGYLEAAGINHRIYTKELTDLQQRLVNAKCNGIENVASLIWETITRCRMKAVVDQGCSHMELLFQQMPDLIDGYFSKALNLLLLDGCSVRTLCISRILWSCCASNHDNFLKLWKRIECFLNFSTNHGVLSRILKTLKLFLSKSICDFPVDVYDTLFTFCIDIQKHSDFLVRSSAIILFGFTVRAITKSKNQPLFYLIINWKNIWRKIICFIKNGLCEWILSQRIIFLSFLSLFYIGNQEFYSSSDINIIGELQEILSDWLLNSSNIRERRFCIDVIVQLMTKNTQKKVLNQTQESSFFQKSENLDSEDLVSENSQVDLSYLVYMLKRDSDITILGKGKIVVPTDLLVSPFVQRVEQTRLLVEKWILEPYEHEIEKHINSLNDLPISEELSSQCAAYVLCHMSSLFKVIPVSKKIAYSFVGQCLRILSGELNRAKIILSRVAVELNLTAVLLQDFYLIKLLLQWADGNQHYRAA